MIVSHYENNYVGAVIRLSAIAEHLGDLDLSKAPAFQINSLKPEELVAMNTMLVRLKEAERGMVGSVVGFGRMSNLTQQNQ